MDKAKQGIINIRNFCIISHVDHGKSTLADRMLELTQTIAKREMKEQLLDQMELERERGITIKLAPVRMIYQNQNSNFILNLIDTPGHVDFCYEVSRSLAAVEGAILLVDATQGVQAQTVANLQLAKEAGLVIIPVINKIDLKTAAIEETKREIRAILNDEEAKILEVSAKTGQGVEELISEIGEKIPPPSSHYSSLITSYSGLRALVFDSIWNRHRGVIVYVRIIDGRMKKGDEVYFLAAAAKEKVLEVGFFKPKLTPAEKLSAGEIGYLITGLKNISQARVGETITKCQNLEPLPGYQEPKPMVFASFYSVGGETDELCQALEKLKLNDASLSFEKEQLGVLGVGFRCGFLGLLHLEIIKERLEREYNLELLVTAPQVAYRKMQNANLKMQNYEEPWTRLEIITPRQYLGAIMQKLEQRRAEYKDTDYLGGRVRLTYEAPLAEIITDFYDELKSLSAGYGSMNYELIDYRQADLVYLEIFVAGEKVEPLSQWLHRAKAERHSRELTEKLKNLLPRQLFEVKIQGWVDGRIIASERIPALRKDVTAKLYGGDVTRKRKLLEKQKKGKKQLLAAGRVEIPPEVFVKIFR